MKKILLLTFFPLIAFAAEVNYPAISGETPGNNISSFARYAFMFFVAFSGAIGVLAFIISGVKFLTSAGDIEKIAEAKSRMLSAFWGTLIILSSYFILNTINPEITTLKEPTIATLAPSEPMPSPPIDNVPTDDLLERIRRLVEKTKEAQLPVQITASYISVLTEHCDCKFTKAICDCKNPLKCPEVPWYTTYKNLKTAGTIGDSKDNWINLNPGDYVSGIIGKAGEDGINFSVGFAPGSAIDIYSKINAPGGIKGFMTKEKPESPALSQGNIDYVLNTLQPPVDFSNCVWYEQKSNDWEYWSQTWKCKTKELTASGYVKVMSGGSDIISTVESVSNSQLVIKHQCASPTALVKSFYAQIEPKKSLADIIDGTCPGGFTFCGHPIGGFQYTGKCCGPREICKDPVSNPTCVPVGFNCPDITNPYCYYCPGDASKNTNISPTFCSDPSLITCYCGPDSAGYDTKKIEGIDDNDCHKCYDFSCDIGASSGVNDKCVNNEECQYYYTNGIKNAVCCPANQGYRACSSDSHPENRICCQNECIVRTDGPACCDTKNSCGLKELENQVCCKENQVCLGAANPQCIDIPPVDPPDQSPIPPPLPPDPPDKLICESPVIIPGGPTPTPLVQELACSAETCFTGEKYHPCGEDRYQQLKIYQKDMAGERDVMVYYKNRITEEKKDLIRDIEKFLNPTLLWFDDEINRKYQETKQDSTLNLSQINFLKERKSWIEEEKKYKQDILDQLERLERALDNYAESQNNISVLPDKCLTNVKLACTPECSRDGAYNDGNDGDNNFSFRATYGCHNALLGCKGTVCKGGNPCPYGEIAGEEKNMQKIYDDVKAMANNIILEIAEIKKERKPKYTIY